MLFHTPIFLFVFLPIAFAGYFLLAQFAGVAAFFWLGLASLVFYGHWNPAYVPLILVSIVLNFSLGWRIARENSCGRERRANAWMWLGVAANVGALIYYKYLAFAVGQIAGPLGLELTPPEIELPIGISFYTFTQIAYLVDVRRRVASERNFISYLLFVSYFPHLVAGPLLHHKEMMPQFADHRNTRLNLDNVARGVTLFAIGLFKKVVIADGLAPTANAFFDSPLTEEISAGTAWTAALTYMLQLYFDFSGYSDMAIGLSLLFNVRLPINFDSPYRSTSIIEFWRRWHMTLSRFLRDYVYIGLGGSRRGRVRRYFNLLLTMIIGGIWHGANWTFIVWGTLHGLLLVVNHSWRWVLTRSGTRARQLSESRGAVLAYWILTFVSVMLAWVIFRSPSIEFAVAGLGRMMDVRTVIWGAWKPTAFDAWLAILVAWVAFAPNTNQLMGYWFGANEPREPLRRWMSWRLNGIWAVTIASMLMLSAVVGLTQRDKLEFLYFQF